ncbi:MAG: hypothetical protein JWN78_2493 [Bacteroidota bacterium]|nr:hypothetical protein [Bacteroidota bacterium]
MKYEDIFPIGTKNNEGGSIRQADVDQITYPVLNKQFNSFKGKYYYLKKRNADRIALFLNEQQIKYRAFSKRFEKFADGCKHPLFQKIDEFLKNEMKKHNIIYLKSPNSFYSFDATKKILTKKSNKYTNTDIALAAFCLSLNESQLLPFFQKYTSSISECSFKRANNLVTTISKSRGTYAAYQRIKNGLYRTKEILEKENASNVAFKFFSDIENQLQQNNFKLKP